MSSLRMMLAIAAALAGIAVTIALGNWQLRRAAEKVATEQAWQAASHAEPLELRAASEFAALAAHLPRRVRIRGSFEHERTIWLDNRALEGRAGFFVVTPLRLQGSEARVMVNRGWAPRDPNDRTHLPPIAKPGGTIEIEGLAVPGVARVLQFAGADSGPIRQNLDLAALPGELGALVAEFVVQQTSAVDDGLDRRWPPPASGVERHRGYAFQWFSLATLLAIVAVGLGWHALRKRGEESAA
jgi:surfeit locus 1 family protein